MLDISIYRHAFIIKSVIQVFRKEYLLSGRKESGGGLFGYVSSDMAVVITHASGPGPRAIKKETSIKLKGEYIQNYADLIYYQSNYCFDYIGDWHIHHGTSLKPSLKDVVAMKLVSKHPSLIKNPISIIYRGKRSFQSEKIAVYCYNSNFLHRIKTSILDNVPKGD